MIFVNVVLPVFLVFAAGYLLQKKLQIQIKPLSQVVFYLLLPCLVFRILYTADILGNLKDIVLFQVILTATLVAVVKVSAVLLKMPPKMEGGMLLATVFMNAGNYGAPFNLFAFGRLGFELAITYYVFQSLLMNTLGVYFASKHQGSFRQSLAKVLCLPVLYAAIAGILLQLFSLEVPGFLYKTIDLLSNATAPLIMILLGMQLAQVKVVSRWVPITLGVLLRLVVSPLIGFAILYYILPVQGLLAKVLIIQAAMPAAVVTTLLAVQYECEPDVVSAINFTSTLVSMGTLSALLYLLTAYFPA